MKEVLISSNRETMKERSDAVDPSDIIQFGLRGTNTAALSDAQQLCPLDLLLARHDSRMLLQFARDQLLPVHEIGQLVVHELLWMQQTTDKIH